MSNYVEIKSSPGEIISIANGIRSKGTDLQAQIAGINADIVAHETDGKSLTPDPEFTAPFRTNTYDLPVPGADGKTVPAHEAVRASAAYCAEKLVAIGDFVAGAMVNYQATDEQGGDDIAKTQV